MARLKPVSPIRPVAHLSAIADNRLPAGAWQGGKRNLARTITAILDQAAHNTYAEPFVGMGGIFLRPVEVRYTIGKKPTSRGKRGELLIGNFHWPVAGGGSQRSRKET